VKHRGGGGSGSGHIHVLVGWRNSLQGFVGVPTAAQSTFHCALRCSRYIHKFFEEATGGQQYCGMLSL
jgi:hypothetical protein